MRNNIYDVRRKTETYEVVVCGGGLAGFCAAVAAARNGARVCIIQDRPVFGGNSSSEIRVKPHGADRHHCYGRETGIIMELMIEERARNHVEIFSDNGWLNSVWDMVLYDTALKTPNLVFRLNTSVIDVILDSKDKIKSVIARVEHAETEIEIYGDIFIDCTGDGVVAARAGCEWRMGEESRIEFGEAHAPMKASSNTMGSSLHFCARNMGYPIPFNSPEWAIKYNDASYFYDKGRVPYTPKGGYWWLEIGTPWHTIYDNEEIRHELTCHLLGVWDWIKNKDPQLKDEAKNYAIDWIGQVPGKRESRRIMGKYLMKEQDVVNKTRFQDEIAYGGFLIDIHTVGGLLAETSEPVNATKIKDKNELGDDIDERNDLDETSDVAVKAYVGPYGIPLRILISKDISNLMMAGRNVSTTHAAFGTLRVMSTTSLMGQAAGTAAAVAISQSLPISYMADKGISIVQQTLLKDGCFLPHFKNEDKADIARKAKVSASSSAKLYGIGPENKNWMSDFFSFFSCSEYCLKQRMGQFISIGQGRLDKVSVCLTNHTDIVQKVKASLYLADHIWDYDSSSNKPVLCETILDVPPCEVQWVDWNIGLGKESGLKPYSYVRLDLHENANVAWLEAGSLEPYHVCVYEIAPGKMRKYKKGTSMSFKVEPGQDVYNPENILTGVIKPHKSTNLWRSSSENPLPEWMQLQWDSPQKISKIILTFPGYQTFEFREYPPFFRDPETAKDFSIYSFLDGKWTEIVNVKDNYQYRQCFELKTPVYSECLKIIFYSTNGSECAGLYEIRCYEE